ncbi:MAG: hypothetical protein GY847_38985 [Proteobacteria bacterium]|nr:hypothetical protein [Pseudomonadota bacterium]
MNTGAIQTNRLIKTMQRLFIILLVVTLSALTLLAGTGHVSSEVFPLLFVFALPIFAYGFFTAIAIHNPIRVAYQSKATHSRKNLIHRNDPLLN